MGRRAFSIAILALALCSVAFGGSLDVATIYNGQSAIPNTLKIGNWGADGKSTDPIKPVAVKSAGNGIPIKTAGRYQGTRFDFASPIDTTQFFGQQDAFIELYVRTMPDDKAKNKTTAKMPDLTNLRFTFFTQTGIGTYSVQASDFYPKSFVNGGWFCIDLPLSKLDTKTNKIGGTMNRLVISSDEDANFLLGRLAFIREVSAIRMNIATYPATLEVGKQIYFSSGVDGGASACTVSWDFDTAGGASVDATGDRVTYTYANPGTYMVTCTARDANGVKDPVTVTREIHVVRPTK
ncbi:MAG TPA: PKD domain-containing protein [Armatimonadota bacterium]|nr:PKD domain-containing protein [Armatimonadota bacterium]